jgi:hypothetical protein
MLIVGKRTRLLQIKTSSSAICNNCDRTGGIEFSCSSKHIQFFWIPTFAYNKTGESQCLYCDETLTPKKMSAPLRREYEGFKATVPFKFLHFIGLLVYPLFFAFLIHAFNEDDKLEATYIQSPIVGDVYTIKKDRKVFTIARVSSIDSLGVYVQNNSHVVKKRLHLYRIDSLHLYDSILTRYSFADLDSMLSNGWIDGVQRD